MYNATHSKSFGMRLTAINEVHRIINDKLDDIIVFIYRWVGKTLFLVALSKIST